MRNRKVMLLPYSGVSRSAKVLSRGLGIRRIKLVGSRYKPHHTKVIINWGCSSPPNDLTGSYMINEPHAVGLAINKLKTFKHLQQGEVPTVPWTTDLEEAMGWNEDREVYSRTRLTSHSGGGIIVNERGEGVVKAPLYTKRLGAKQEWRVHVAFGEVIDVRRKAKREGIEGNKYIKNHGNGYVFKMRDNDIPHSILTVGVDAVNALGLHFGSVDLLVYKDEPYVLEVNTASGLRGSTVDNYVNIFREELGI